MTTPDLPEPPWAPPPRYGPDVPLPPYRYVPLGRHPHPTMDPGGHMQKKPPEPDETPSALAWMTNAYWLTGVDLYNRFYLWEASETWEPLWRRCGRTGASADMVQALIMVCGALLKIQCQESEGVVAFWKNADDRFRRVLASDDEMWGLPVKKTWKAYTKFFSPLVDKGRLPKLDKSVPKLVLPM